MRRFALIFVLAAIVCACTGVKLVDETSLQVRFSCSVDGAPSTPFGFDLLAARRGKPYHRYFRNVNALVTDTLKMEEGDYSFLFFKAAEPDPANPVWSLDNINEFVSSVDVPLDSVRSLIATVPIRDSFSDSLITLAEFRNLPVTVPAFYCGRTVCDFPWKADTSVVHSLSFPIQQVIRKLTVRVRIVPASSDRPVNSVLANLVGIPSGVDMLDGSLDGSPGHVGQVVFDMTPETAPAYDGSQVFTATLYNPGVISPSSRDYQGGVGLLYMYVDYIGEDNVDHKLLRVLNLYDYLVSTPMLKPADRIFHYIGDDSPFTLDITDNPLTISGNEGSQGSGEEPVGGWADPEDSETIPISD